MEHDGKIFDFNNNFFHKNFMIPLGRIMQVAELSVIRGFEINEHRQVCEEITYVISGSAKFYCNNKYEEVREGQIHFIKRGNIHRIVASQESNFRYICIGVQLNKDEASAKQLLENVGDADHVIMEDNGTIKDLTEHLLREFYSWDENSTEMVNHYIVQILITLSRLLTGNVISFRKNTKEKSSSYAIYEILRYIDREYMKIKNVNSLSQQISYSEYYLSHLFKEKMGITVKEYLTKKKIAYATELLSTSDVSVEQISETLGFSSSHSFRRAFKQYTGITPTDFKEKS